MSEAKLESSACSALHDALAESDMRRMESHGGGLTCAHYGGERDAYRQSLKVVRDSAELQLIKRLAALNPKAGEIGPGMMRQLVDAARSITGEWDDACPDCAGETFTDEGRLRQCRQCGWHSSQNR